MGNYNKNLFDRFLAGIAVVNVKTHDEYDQFMRMLEKETNLKWWLGQKPTQLDIFTSHREKTCIHRVVGRYMIKYSDISYYESKEYEIIEFSDLIKSPTTSIKKPDAPLTQNDRVVAYMKKEHGITTLEAFKNLGVTRLSARIHDIRDMGYVVGDEFIKVIDRNGTETRVKTYWLINEPKKDENGE